MNVSTVSQMMRSLNQRPIAVYPIYIQMTGKLTSAYLLSQIMYWFASSGKDKIYKTNDEIIQETSLSLDEFKSAKRLLKQIPWLTISIEGVPARTYYEIDWEGYVHHLASISQQYSNQLVENPPTSWCEIHQQAGGKSTNITETTTEITTESPKEGAREKTDSSQTETSEIHATAPSPDQEGSAAPRPPHTDELEGRRMGKAQQLWIEMEVPRHVAADRRPLLAEWLEYRSEIGRPVLSRHEMKELIAFFNKHGPGDLREMMAHSMRAGYPNLYPDSLNRQNKQQDVRSQKRSRPGRPDWSKYYPPS